MILIAAIAMTTLAAQADDMQKVEQAAVTAVAVDTEAPAATDTDGDTNGTEEAAPEGK